MYLVIGLVVGGFVGRCSGFGYSLVVLRIGCVGFGLYLVWYGY